MRLKAYRDKRAKQVATKWVACMADAGFKYKSVDAPFDEFGDGRPVSTKEISVAKVDVSCTKPSRWRDTTVPAEQPVLRYPTRAYSP